jgi:hypothetical protein
MTVAPGPVLLLVVLVELSEVTMRISMSFHHPLLVIDSFVVVPVVVVAVVGVVNPPVVVVFGTADSGQRQ